MGKRARRRVDGFTAREPTPLLIVHARSEDGVGLILKKAFVGARFFSELAAVDLQSADLAIGIFEGSDHQRLHAFAGWAHAAGVPALCLELREKEALLGPLALPHRAGCGYCAVERRTAASATESYTGCVAPSPVVAKVVGPLLVREVRTIMRRGPKRSQLLDHILAVDVQTLDASLHQIIPLSRCTICGGATAFPRTAQEPVRLSPEDSPEVVLGALAGWVDQRTGVISSVVLEPPSHKDMDLPIIATAAPPHIRDEKGSLRRLPLGWGKGLTIAGAVLSAVGEAIERYAASLPDFGRIIWERLDDLEGECVDPRAFALYTDAQYERDGFPYARFDPNIRHPWILGKWFGSGAPVWAPAVFAFLSLPLQAGHLICQGSSNGLAASTDQEEATLRAVLELVERDAFMAAWLTACPGRRVTLDETLDPLLRRVLDGLASLGAAVEVYFLSTSICGATALCLGLGDGDTYPGATIGLGTDLDARSALRRAVLELAQTGPYLRRMMRSHAVPVPREPYAVREMLQHAAYYFPRERATAFNRLRNKDAPLALRDLTEGEPKPSLATCRAELEAAGVRVALVDVTSADVATGPFRVMRAISPDLQSISYGYGVERSPVERIRIMQLASEIPAIHPIW